jgi:hypothetical protein
MAPEREYGFGQGESVITVVQRTPVGTEVTEGARSDPAVEAAIETGDIPGVEVEVIETDPAVANPLATALPDEDARASKRASKKAASGPSAAFGPVGPDPEQEATKRVAVKTTAKSVTGATGPTSKKR